MKDQNNIIGWEGLQFFGKVSASISHEIKNTLAIINENAGLLGDLSAMMDRGMPMDPERLKKVAETIQNQVRRADGIVKRMNRFAHSVDEPLKEVDLSRMVDLLIAIADRLAQMKDIVVESTGSGTVWQVRTYPFVLENLIWRSLDFAMGAVGSDRHIRVFINNTDMGKSVSICGIGEPPDAEGQLFPSETEAALALRLRANLALNTDAGELTIELPDRVEQGISI